MTSRRPPLPLLVALFVVALVDSAPAFPQTDSTAPIVWTRTMSPVRLDADLVVASGSTLTIEPGVELLAGPHAIRVESGATLSVHGLPHQPVLLSAVDPAVGWKGIELAPNAAAALDHCIVERVLGDLDGSGAALRGTDARALVTRCTFRFNTNFRPRLRGNGAGIAWKGGELTVQDSYFRGNHADSGAALHLLAARASVTESRFELNLTRASGGAVYAGPGSEVTLHGGIFLTNQAEQPGGAIAAWNRATVRVESCIFVKNRSNHGGAVYSRYADVSVTQCTLTGNRALTGAAFAVESAKGVVLDVDHSIVWDPRGSAAVDPSAEGKIRVRYSCVEGGWNGLGNRDQQPRFRDPTSLDFSLQDDSPCRDAGLPAVGPTRTDFRGRPRNDAKRDLGAHEWSPRSPDPLDLDGNGVVDARDLEAWPEVFRPGAGTAPTIDVNADGRENLADWVHAVRGVLLD